MVKKEGIVLRLRSRRAMSPLVATVLLIAFAVALGAMIMNWSSSLGDLSGPDCSGITMIINPYVCYAKNILRISVQNTGNPVEALTFKARDINNNEANFKYNAKVVSGEIFAKEYAFEKTARTRVDIIPSVNYQDKVVECDKSVLSVDDLKDCTG